MLDALAHRWVHLHAGYGCGRNPLRLGRLVARPQLAAYWRGSEDDRELLPDLAVAGVADHVVRIGVDAEHRKRQFAERFEAWPDWEDHGLVFPSRRGTPIEPDNLRRSWSAIRERAGLGPTRFHDLRHTGVTLLLDLGTPPHVVQEIVGHSAIEVTMTIYAHVSLDEKRKALRKLGEALG